MHGASQSKDVLPKCAWDPPFLESESTMNDTNERDAAGVVEVVESVAVLRTELPQELLPYEYKSAHDNQAKRLYRSAAKNYAVHKARGKAELHLSSLIAMSIGSTGYETILADPLVTKGVPCPDGSYIKISPSNVVCQKEVVRRFHFLVEEKVGSLELRKDGSKRLQPPGVRTVKPDLVRWLLEKNNVLPMHSLDEAFLKAKIDKLRHLACLVEGTDDTKAAAQWNYKNWIGLHPWVRLCHVVESDEGGLRELFLHRNDKMSRIVLENRSSEKCPPTYWDKAAELFNNEEWMPWSYALSDHGPWFVESQDLSWDKLSQLEVSKIDADTFKKKYTKLYGYFKTIKYNYSLSGEGEGSSIESLTDADSDFEDDKMSHEIDADDGALGDLVSLKSIKSRASKSLGNRSGDKESYVNNKPKPALYLWYILERNDLCDAASAEAHASVSVEAGRVPSILRGQKTVAESVSATNEQTKMLQQLASQNMRHSNIIFESSMVRGQVQDWQNSIREIKSAIFDLKAKMLDFKGLYTGDALDERLELCKEQILNLETEMAGLQMQVQRYEAKQSANDTDLALLKAEMSSTVAFDLSTPLTSNKSARKSLNKRKGHVVRAKESLSSTTKRQLQLEEVELTAPAAASHSPAAASRPPVAASYPLAVTLLESSDSDDELLTSKKMFKTAEL
jgi:predicted  nucleic acid-binding Zn-ribbon protein